MALFSFSVNAHKSHPSFLSTFTGRNRDFFTEARETAIAIAGVFMFVNSDIFSTIFLLYRANPILFLERKKELVGLARTILPDFKIIEKSQICRKLKSNS